MLMQDGRTVFLGSKDESVSYFSKQAGIEFPRYANPADIFLRELSRKKFEVQ